MAALGETRQQSLHVRRKALGRTEVGVSSIVKHMRPAPSDAEAKRCYLGHEATSATSSGKPKRNVNPARSYCPGRVSGDVKLCSACFKRLIG